MISPYTIIGIGIILTVLLNLFFVFLAAVTLIVTWKLANNKSDEQKEANMRKYRKL